MNYSKEALEIIYILNTYEEVNTLNTVDLIHLYDTGRVCIDDDSGYHDSRHFTLWGFNVELKQKTNLGIHDAVSFVEGNLVLFVRIFLDGSTLIKFKYPVAYALTQDVKFYDP